jgi:hypothetical protein
MVLSESTNIKYGRFANQFIRAMAAHFISKNLSISAAYPFNMKDFLGIQLNNVDNIIDKGNIIKIDLTEDNFIDYINNIISLKDNTLLNLNNIFCQTKEHALKIYDFVNQDVNKGCIIKHNKYSDTMYGKNNHVFVHVRLGDVINNNPGLNYYKEVLSKIKFNNGYISSDSINHPICSQLIDEFKLKPLSFNEIDTIHFGSMCKYIVLSNGTFSWLIGLLGFSSDIYWPEIKKVWHGDIFDCMPNWKKVYY